MGNLKDLFIYYNTSKVKLLILVKYVWLRNRLVGEKKLEDIKDK